MKKKALELDSDFTQLLVKLGSDASNPCLFGGGGWVERVAWNPCDTYILDSGNKIDEKLKEFVAYHQNKKHLVAGYLSYDLGYQLQNLPEPTKGGSSLPYAVFFAYDNYLEKTGDMVYAYYQNDGFIEELTDLDKSVPAGQNVKTPDFKLRWDSKSFDDAFDKIKRYIYEGVVYQINLTQELRGESDDNPRHLFAELANKNTAKMKAYLEDSGFELLSMSPERFIRSDGKAIETSPIKGTRPRGKNGYEDKDNEASLLSDEKEKAELNMITDLLRNDLGKVCEPGSIKVLKKRQLEKLTSVMHTSSLIQGELKKGSSPIEALLSMFPGGSITGCPKKKAMEIIDGLEQSARGPYCGCMVTLDKDGNLDSSILIRTIIKQGKKLSLSVGSGIVYDSDKQKEYQETFDKAAPLIRSLL